MKRKTAYQANIDSVKVLLYEAKVRNDFTDRDLAGLLGITERTLTSRRADPSAFTLDKFFLLLELAGKEVQYTQKQTGRGGGA